MKFSCLCLDLIRYILNSDHSSGNWLTDFKPISKSIVDKLDYSSHTFSTETKMIEKAVPKKFVEELVNAILVWEKKFQGKEMNFKELYVNLMEHLIHNLALFEICRKALTPDIAGQAFNVIVKMLEPKE